MNPDTRLWILAIILACSIAFAIWHSGGNNHAAYRDPIYQNQLKAEKMMRDANAVPVRIVK
jgi:hypothetical protein